jgi:hypothetical protein
VRPPRLRLRTLLILVAFLALALVFGRRLIVGDSRVTVEFVNGIGRPIRDIRLAGSGDSIIADELAPGGRLRGRLPATELRAVGVLNAEFLMSFAIDGKAASCGWSIPPLSSSTSRTSAGPLRTHAAGRLSA